MHRLLFALLLSAGCAWAQSGGCDPGCAAAALEKQFGPGFALVAGFPALTGDLDGDGVEDLLLVAQGKDPFANSLDYQYKVIDPYDAYFGYGTPKITAQFAAGDTERSRLLLIVHSWHEAAPKAKYIVLNLPFESVSLARARVKKRIVSAIRIEESVGITSSLFWDGKKYKWQPGGN